MKILRFSFGVFAYLFFFATFLYLVGFVSNAFVPRSIDVGPNSSWPGALVVNLLLISLFGVQHSVMARPWFKSRLTRFWPQSVERSLYVAMSALALYVLFLFWQPMPAVLWSVASPEVRTLLWTFAGLGWLIVLIATFLLNHFELFGLRQIWHDLVDKELPEASFRQPFFYKLVRHPIYTGFLIAFWVTPDMTVGHLLFNVGFTVYIWIGVHYEEVDLRADLGQDYIEYSKKVGKILPGIGKSA